jgi:hypothetical protein
MKPVGVCRFDHRYTVALASGPNLEWQGAKEPNHITTSQDKKTGRRTMATTLINDYEVMYSANTFPPRIWLVNSGTFIGQLIFHPDGAALPPDDKSGGQVNLHYHLDDFENCATLLRNEKTVYLLYSGSGPGFENGLLTAETIPGT